MNYPRYEIWFAEERPKILGTTPDEREARLRLVRDYDGASYLLRLNADGRWRRERQAGSRTLGAARHEPRTTPR